MVESMLCPSGRTCRTDTLWPADPDDEGSCLSTDMVAVAVTIIPEMFTLVGIPEASKVFVLVPPKAEKPEPTLQLLALGHAEHEEEQDARTDAFATELAARSRTIFFPTACISDITD